MTCSQLCVTTINFLIIFVLFQKLQIIADANNIQRRAKELQIKTRRKYQLILILVHLLYLSHLTKEKFAAKNYFLPFALDLDFDFLPILALQIA